MVTSDRSGFGGRRSAGGIVIRERVVAQSRDVLWQLVRQRSDLLERGMTLVAEQLDLGMGGLGVAEGLFRDAAGDAVLVFVSDASDSALGARVLAAHSFCERNLACLPRALPEAQLRTPAGVRLLVVASVVRDDMLAALRRLEIRRLEVVEVEAFRVGGSERLAFRNRMAAAAGPAVRNVPAEPTSSRATSKSEGEVFQRSRCTRELPVDGVDCDVDAPGGVAEKEEHVALVEPEGCHSLTRGVLGATLDGIPEVACRQRFVEMATFLTRLDPEIRVQGDRFSRRAACGGLPLCEYWYEDGQVLASAAGDVAVPLGSTADVRSFGDRVARLYLQRFKAESGASSKGGATVRLATAEKAGSEDVASSTRGRALEALRASVSRARLSGEEFQALGGAASGSGGDLGK